MKHLPLFAGLLPLLFSAAAGAQTFTCGDTLVDPRDGKQYRTLLIGSDCWMKDNLNYGQFVQSDSTGTPHADVFNDGNVQKFCQGNDSMNCITYGGLYDWNELMDYDTASGSQGICPPGWHVATDAEWNTLITTTGGTISGTAGSGGNALKALGEGFGAGTGTNSSGFSARAGGDRDSYGIFYGMGLRSIFWTSTRTMVSAWQYTLWAENDTIQRLGQAQTMSGFSCRCVQDAPAGVTEPGQEPWIRLAPNPAVYATAIHIGQYYNEGDYLIRNLLGQQVAAGPLEGSDVQVSLEALPAGVYSVSIRLDNKVFTRQLLIAGR